MAEQLTNTLEALTRKYMQLLSEALLINQLLTHILKNYLKIHFLIEVKFTYFNFSNIKFLIAKFFLAKYYRLTE